MSTPKWKIAFRRRSKTRVVRYGYGGPFSEPEMLALLKRAKRDQIITEFDTGRGSLVWFEGPPGERMRELRAKVEVIISAT